MSTRIHTYSYIFVISALLIAPIISQAGSPTPYNGNWQVIADQAAVPTISTAPYQTPLISPTSGFVLYSRDDGTSWLKDANGDRKILDGHQPRLSPDNRYVVVRRWDTLEGDLYLYDLETGQDTMIFNNNDYVVGFSWSMDGSRIYFDYACGIYSVEPDGSNLNVIIENFPPDVLYSCYNDAPDVNPLDGRLAWHNEPLGIGLSMDDGQNAHWLSNTLEDFTPRWSPDGEWIAFSSHSETKGSYNNLYKIQPDGTNLTQLTFLSPPDSMSFWTGAWETGGTWLLAPATVHGVESLYAVATDGSGMMLPLYTEPGAAPVYVGNAGSWDFHFMHLPLVVR